MIAVVINWIIRVSLHKEVKDKVSHKRFALSFSYCITHYDTFWESVVGENEKYG
jgi:hypothetical protein